MNKTIFRAVILPPFNLSTSMAGSGLMATQESLPQTFPPEKPSGPGKFLIAINVSQISSYQYHTECKTRILRIELYRLLESFLVFRILIVS